MWLVSKKKYNALLAQKKDFERIAMNAVAQNSRLLDEWDAAIKEMKNTQKLNHRLNECNEGLLARVKELEVGLQMARQDNQRWAKDFEELDNAYDRLETDYDRLREELAHYEYKECFCSSEDGLLHIKQRSKYE